MSVQLPPMLDRQRDAWWALLDLHERMPSGWALIGGQMVHLHCAERGTSPMRPTDDADVGIDVRAYPVGLAWPGSPASCRRWASRRTAPRGGATSIAG